MVGWLESSEMNQVNIFLKYEKNKRNWKLTDKYDFGRLNLIYLIIDGADVQWWVSACVLRVHVGAVKQ